MHAQSRFPETFSTVHLVGGSVIWLSCSYCESGVVSESLVIISGECSQPLHLNSGFVVGLYNASVAMMRFDKKELVRFRGRATRYSVR